MPPSLSRQLGARVSEQSVCGTASGGGNWVHKLVVYVTNGRHFLKKKTKHFPFTCFQITHGVTRGSFSTFFEVLCYQRLAPIEGFPTVERTERRSPPRVTEDFFFTRLWRGRRSGGKIGTATDIHTTPLWRTQGEDIEFCAWILYYSLLFYLYGGKEESESRQR